jgi:hypothetical protein
MCQTQHVSEFWRPVFQKDLIVVTIIHEFINYKVHFKTLTNHCLSSHSRRGNTTPTCTCAVYQCPCSRSLIRAKHASLPSFFLPSLDHAVAPGSPIPSLQYQEPRNSDLFSQFPLLLALA